MARGNLKNFGKAKSHPFGSKEHHDAHHSAKAGATAMALRMKTCSHCMKGGKKHGMQMGGSGFGMSHGTGRKK